MPDKPIEKKNPSTTMKRAAFKMKLYPGKKEEYRKRHDEIWPELADLLTKSGIHEYSIFLDEETNTLFAVYSLTDDNSVDELHKNPLMKKWWAYMKDIMTSNPDNSPESKPLEEVFYLP